MTDLLEAHPTGQATSTGHRVLPASVAGHPRNCRCLECCDLAAAWAANRRRQLAYGTWQPFIDAEPVLAHIEAVHDSGIAYRQIAIQAGLTLWELHLIRRGDHASVRPKTAAAILAVKPDPRGLDPKAFLPPRGAVRRLQALSAHGWPKTELAWRCNRSRDRLSAILSSPFVWASTHLAIVELYEDLHDQNPVRHGVEPWLVQRGVRYARKHDWAPPSAWSDIDADEHPAPSVQWAVRYAKPVPGEGSEALLEQVCELADQGEVRAAIEARVGRSWGTITTAFNRAGLSVPAVAA
ncbi:hypothetical protein ABIA32_002743 [Streptacidiphilus sp. MAP12-20]|uniref:hypothetical protein n=1 Tax=Streptacidiphilus sp. MAP12-20 TaxID=3156299 RepID=UPI003510FB38